MIGVVRDITEQKQAEEALWTLNETLEEQVVDRTRLAEARAKQIQALAVELIQAEEGERHRIANLLHEDFQQILASARFQIQTALQTMAYEKILRTVDTLLGECIEKSRRLSYELSPPIMNQFELADALKWLGRQMEKRFGMQVIVKADTKQPVDSSLKTFLFRAVQELLFNVAKHSGVKAAWVDFSSSDTHIIIKVSDQGRGFNPEILDSSTIDTGLGLLSIRERANYIGGSLKIESRPAQGSQITLRIPLKDSQ
jgi:signal transduction histidine kinase